MTANATAKAISRVESLSFKIHHKKKGLGFFAEEQQFIVV
jgi:hypothetical protein